MEEQITELSKRIEHKSGVIEFKLEKLEAKCEKLEVMSEKLERCQHPLSGEEHWDGVTREEIKRFVYHKIEKHVADYLARPDYATNASGAYVLTHSELLTIAPRTRDWNGGVNWDAKLMLKPSFSECGECFRLKGTRGFVEIKLAYAIVLEAVTLEHVTKNVYPGRSSAPKDCTIYGWFSMDSSWRQKISLLAGFTYDLYKRNVQTFNLSNSTTSPGIIDSVRFEFACNHGNPLYTCIYHFRVHGHTPDS